MKIKLTKYTFENGDISIDTDCSNNPFSRIKKEEEQEIEIDDNLWEEVKRN